MFKTAIATLAATAAVVAPSAALAGPYVNVEANSAFTGSDYTGTTTDAHVKATLVKLVPSPGAFKLVLALLSPTVVSLTPFCLARHMPALLLPRH